MPDFLAARLPGLLASIEESVTVASSAKSMEAAADALRGLDITLPSAVRWLRRRMRAVRTALLHVAPEAVIGALGREPSSGGDLDEGRLLLGLRRSLSPPMMNSIPAPLGFRPACDVGRQPAGNGQHGMGPGREVADQHGLLIDGDQARWDIRSNNALPRSREYADHLGRHRGNLETTVHKKLAHSGKLSEHLAGAGKVWDTMALTDIDAFLIGCAERYARSTVADIAGSVRCFARFLLATGRISIDLAEAVISPVQPTLERHRRALPWTDVRRLLRSVAVSSPSGLRGYALLLMMSTYGFGAGEVIRLQLHDIDWNAATLKVVRPKTGVGFMLPLLPAVAKALAFYLRDGRPPSTPARHVFVRMKMPFSPLSGSSAVRHILVKHATAAGLNAPYLGSHVLRHSKAARQIDLGIRPRVLSDLLGHGDPESISAYVRIATETLRDISLPVPA